MNNEDLNIGISLDELREMFDYIAGKADKPEFVDRFMSDINGRLKEMLIVVNEISLSNIPQLLEYRNKVQKELFSKERIDTMDAKELSAVMMNLDRNIMSTVEIANRTVYNINKNESINSDYRNLLNRLLLLTEDKLKELQNLFKEE